MSKKSMLVILDGWGHGSNKEWSAIDQANTAFMDSVYSNYPNAELTTYGEQVGLPVGQMGNSEVGHLNIGAGRIVYQELARINKAIEDGSFINQERIKATIEYAGLYNKPIHLLGLVSDGGVHCHLDHLIALCQYFSEAKIQVYIHAILDGRDTDPHGGANYVRKLLDSIDHQYCEISTLIGRYYAMDRDQRWERIKMAYDLIVKGQGDLKTDAVQAIEACYQRKLTDEFIPAIKLASKDRGLIQDGDLVFFANFRTDRPRQLTEALSQKDFSDYDMKKLSTYFVMMTEYDKTFENVFPVFTKEELRNTLGEVISKNKLKQLRIAETEKYPHVTFFFSGGREKEFEGESRILVNSPKVATYDLQPEMSAYEVTTAVCNNIQTVQADLIILNYANADMVGHTGDFQAAIKAVETLDSCMEVLIHQALKAEYEILIIADHGNCDQMLNEDGSPHTAHTTNMVPIILLSSDKNLKLSSGKLADISPTLLHLMGVEAPAEMTGDVLVG